jgi:nucleoside-diphosphate-sugar epimerase
MTNRKALVTGSTGFVGSNLTRRLVHDGWNVHAIIRPKCNLDQIKDIEGQITLHVHDGSTEIMNRIVTDAQPDVVFHLASLFLSEHTSNDIDRLVVSNILFGTQLLDAMAAHEVTKIVNTGTSWQHYENKPYSPVNLYAATKQAFEAILQYYVEAKKVSAITLKLFDTYGPNDPRPKLFHLLEKVAKDGSTLAMSPGDQLIDLVHIDDVIEAFVLAAKRLESDLSKNHEVYAVTSGTPLSLRSVVKIFENAIEMPLKIEWGGRPYRPREVMVPLSRGEALPGWKAEIEFKEGVKSMWRKVKGQSK